MLHSASSVLWLMAFLVLADLVAAGRGTDTHHQRSPAKVPEQNRHAKPPHQNRLAKPPQQYRPAKPPHQNRPAKLKHQNRPGASPLYGSSSANAYEKTDSLGSPNAEVLLVTRAVSSSINFFIQLSFKMLQGSPELHYRSGRPHRRLRQGEQPLPCTVN